MLLDSECSLLLIIDVQSRLMPVIERADQAVSEIGWLVTVADHLGVPIWYTEQNPHGLGHTEPRLAATLPGSARGVVKSHFNACREPGFVEGLTELSRPQVVIAGAEAHICVLQTALGLREQGFAVFWLIEGCVSRRVDEARLARERLVQAGGTVVSADMVAYEWLQRSDDTTFRDVHRRLLKPRAGRPLRLTP